MGVALIDLEIESDDEYRQELIAYAKEHDTEVIISWHSFDCTPEREELEDILEEFYFMRVHQSFLVNLFKVVRFEKSNRGRIVLNDVKC